MVEEYKSPGWYPSPDGTPGERWWNGSGWSDSRRDSAEAPIISSEPPLTRPNPYAPVPTAQAQFGTNPAVPYDSRLNRMATAGLVAGAIGIFGFSIVGPIAIVLSVLGIVKARQLKAEFRQSSSIVLAVIGLVMGVIATIMLINSAGAFFAALTVDVR